MDSKKKQAVRVKKPSGKKHVNVRAGHFDEDEEKASELPNRYYESDDDSMSSFDHHRFYEDYILPKGPSIDVSTTCNQ